MEKYTLLKRRNTELIRKNAELNRKVTQLLQKIESQKGYIKYIIQGNHIKLYKIRKELLYTPEGMYDKYKGPKHLPSVKNLPSVK